ncbi:MAG: hypothetical protein ACI4PO_03550 [Faecousia sp.]
MSDFYPVESFKSGEILLAFSSFGTEWMGKRIRRSAADDGFRVSLAIFAFVSEKAHGYGLFFWQSYHCGKKRHSPAGK